MLWRVIVRGVRYRIGRSIVVLVLAVIATAAAVLTPAYTSAAQASLLTDAFDALQPAMNQVRITTTALPQDDTARTKQLTTAMDDAVAQRIELNALSNRLRTADAKVASSGGDLAYEAVSQIGYRENFCEHVTISQGKCQTAASQVLISQRTAEAEGLKVGDSYELRSDDDEDAKPWDVKVAGVYKAHDMAADYWGPRTPFTFGSDHKDSKDFVDAMFVTRLSHLQGLNADLDVGSQYRLDTHSVTPDDVAALSTQLSNLDGSAALDTDHRVKVDSSLDAVIKQAHTGQTAVADAVPIVTVPLMLLCWFVLYLVMARLIEERAPQIALAKLRGHRFLSVTGFGTGEALVLIMAGTPLGVLGAIAVTDAVARSELADGASARFGSEMIIYAAVSLIGAFAAVLLAARGTLNQTVFELLRRIPVRRSWRAGLLEGMAIAVAAVAVWQLLSRNETGSFALFVTPLLAGVVGVAVARGLQWGAGRQLPRAMKRGALAKMLALAQLSRRVHSRRIVVLVTVAVSLATFGVCAWNIAELNRELSVDDQLGADRVYQISGTDPASLMAEVEKLDPKSHNLMGAVRWTDRYDGKQFNVVAAQTDRMSDVVNLREGDKTVTQLSQELHPKMPEPVRVEKSISVKATVNKLSAHRPMKLAARVVSAGQTPHTVSLGKLSSGDHKYHAKLPKCESGCRLLGVGMVRYPGDFDTIEASVDITKLRDHSGVIDANLATKDAWRRAWNVSKNADFTVRNHGDSLRLSANTSKTDDLIAEYATAPDALPVAVAGKLPDAASDGNSFNFLGPHHQLQKYSRTAQLPVIPSAGATAMMVDLDYSNRYAQSVTALADEPELSYEIWANEDAPVNIADKLASDGLTVSQSQQRAALLEQSERSAPALALRLYLLAGGAAVALVIGAALLTSIVGAASRGYDNAALWITGVRQQALRAATIREHLYWIGAPVLAGVVCGVAGLFLVLPKLTVATMQPGVPVEYQIGPWWPIGAAAVTIAGFVAVTWLTLRTQQRHGGSQRLRDGEG